MSGAEVILTACYRLESAPGRGREMTVPEIVVRAWLLNNKLFGLKGFEKHYPDSNKVNYRIAGGTGLVGRGWLERVDSNVYRLTKLGRRLAQIIEGRMGVAT
jgi:hypothetical protein